MCFELPSLLLKTKTTRRAAFNLHCSSFIEMCRHQIVCSPFSCNRRPDYENTLVVCIFKDKQQPRMQVKLNKKNVLIRRFIPFHLFIINHCSALKAMQDQQLYININAIFSSKYTNNTEANVLLLFYWKLITTTLMKTLVSIAGSYHNSFFYLNKIS